MSFLRSVVATQLPIKSSSSTPTRSLVIYEEEEAEKKAEEEPAEELWCETVPLVEVEIKLRNKVFLVFFFSNYATNSQISEGAQTNYMKSQAHKFLDKFMT